MSEEEFNIKYKEYLEEGHYGLAINDPYIISYLDNCFQELILIPDFKYSQIKLKFDNCCFYNTLKHGSLFGKLTYIIQDHINEYFRYKKIFNKPEQPYTTGNE